MKITDILVPELIRYPLEMNDKESAIKELLNLLNSKGLIQDYDAVLDAVLKRESKMTTGVGNGVAIPHCKSQGASQFAIALGIHPAGIDFQSLDSRPAHLIFLLIGPEHKAGLHIRLLSRISRIVAREEVREGLLNARSADNVYQLMANLESSPSELNLS